MAINLDNLSPAELKALILSAEAKMDSARKNHIQEVRSKIDSILKNADLTLGEIYPKLGGGRAKASKVAPAKYRNPADPRQTWSGRGKRPAWFVEAVSKRGVTPEKLLIDGAKSQTAPSKTSAKSVSAKRRATKTATAKKSSRT